MQDSGCVFEYAPPAADAKLATVESELGFALHPDLKSLWKWTRRPLSEYNFPPEHLFFTPTFAVDVKTKSEDSLAFRGLEATYLVPVFTDAQAWVSIHCDSSSHLYGSVVVCREQGWSGIEIYPSLASFFEFNAHCIRKGFYHRRSDGGAWETEIEFFYERPKWVAYEYFPTLRGD